MNRGRGIHLFNDLSTLHKQIEDYYNGYEEKPVKMNATPSCTPGKSKLKFSESTVKEKEPAKFNSLTDFNKFIRVIPDGPCILKA